MSIIKKILKMNSPKVAVLLAIYKPNIDWLIEQLVSVNEQTYGNMELFVYLDDPEDEIDYAAILQEHITKMPFTLQKGEKNLGSNKAFEKLTYMAQEKGDFKYIAFCDQDDVWLPEKIVTLVNEAEKNDLDLVCSDMEGIDRNGKKIYNTINGIYKVEIADKKYTIKDVIKNYLRRRNIFDTLMQFNLFTGCFMLASTRVAYEALPFSQYEWHDHWIALCVAGTSKKILYLSKPLLKRRFHQNNQTVKKREIEIKWSSERYKFLKDLEKVLGNKMNIIDKWMLKRTLLQKAGEIYILEKTNPPKQLIYKIK